MTAQLDLHRRPHRVDRHRITHADKAAAYHDLHAICSVCGRRLQWVTVWFTGAQGETRVVAFCRHVGPIGGDHVQP